MYPIRLQARSCTDHAKIQEFLSGARTGILAMALDEQPYAIPLNFVWKNDAVYFHGASEGRKFEYLSGNPNVCFTVSEEYGTMTSPIPAHTDSAYMSVILFGQAVAVVDPDEAWSAMQSLLDKYVPGYYDQPLSKTHLEKYRSSLGSRTVTFKLNVESMSAKENAASEGSLYYSGKTALDDK